MITVRMLNETESDRLLISISGIKQTESSALTKMLTGLFEANPNIDFKDEGDCSDLKPDIEEQDIESMNECAKKMQQAEKNANAIPEFVAEAEMEMAATNTQQDSSNKKEQGEKVFLKILFADKDKAKELLGSLIRWDGKARKWYCQKEDLEKVIELTKDWKNIL